MSQKTTFIYQGEKSQTNEVNCSYLYKMLRKKASWGTRTILICQWNQITETQHNRNEISSSIKPSLGLLVNLNAKAAKPIFHKPFQSPISETGMSELGETISESTFYILYFTDLTIGKLEVSIFFKCQNLTNTIWERHYKFQMPMQFSVVPSILPQKVFRLKTHHFLYLYGAILAKSIIQIIG